MSWAKLCFWKTHLVLLTLVKCLFGNYNPLAPSGCESDPFPSPSSWFSSSVLVSKAYPAAYSSARFYFWHCEVGSRTFPKDFACVSSASCLSGIVANHNLQKGVTWTVFCSLLGWGGDSCKQLLILLDERMTYFRSVNSPVVLTSDSRPDLLSSLCLIPVYW